MRNAAVFAVGAMVLAGSAAMLRADETDRWTRFRAEQRAELDTLPVVADPPTAPGENPIDAILAAWRKQNSVEARPPCADHALIRRLYLDTVGLLPPPQAVDTFVRDADPGKVARTARSLLDDDRGYAEHWM